MGSNHWPVKRVGEIAYHCLGKMLDKRKNKGEPQPYLRNLNVRWFDFDLSDMLEMKFEDHEFDRYTAKKGDVLICEGGYPGRAAIWEQDEGVFFQKALHRVRFHQTERNKWFLYYLWKCDTDGTLRDHFTGSGIQHFTGKALANFPIPLPPLEEQQRIVAVLDEAFEGLASARAHAEANLQNARELFESCLSAFVERHGGNWSPTVLGDAYDVRDGTHDSPKYHPSGRALITSKNLGRDGLHFEKVKFISEKDFVAIRKRSGVQKGDVLFAMIGTIGNPVVVDVDPDFAIKNVALFKMKDQRSGTLLRFLLRSKHVVEKMRAEAKGTTQQFVGLKYLRSFPISLPKPIDEDAMVCELEQIEAECRSSEDQYVQKVQDLDDLRHSLLQKAFAGELI